MELWRTGWTVEGGVAREEWEVPVWDAMPIMCCGGMLSLKIQTHLNDLSSCKTAERYPFYQQKQREGDGTNLLSFCFATGHL